MRRPGNPAAECSDRWILRPPHSTTLERGVSETIKRDYVVAGLETSRVSLARSWNEIALIGAPVGAGAGTAGCVMGPAALRIVNLRETLAALGHQVVDRGDVRVADVGGASVQNLRARNLREI